MIGAARAALDEYEHIITTRMTYCPPQGPRYTHPDHQRPYGYALALTDTAEGIIMNFGEQYSELSRRWAQTGEPFTREAAVRLYAMVHHAGHLTLKPPPLIFAAPHPSAST